jgi:3-oxoacyl-[acyl-carrier protein] reductase
VDTGLEDKVAIVGGASQGIGFAIARLFAAEGARVAMVARRREILEESAQRVRSETGSEVLAISADIRVAGDCERIVDEACAHFGRLDILVNNDGAPPLGELAEFDDAAWDRAVQQNLMSVVRLSRRAIPHMKARGAGRIVNIAALSARQPMPRFGLSVATWAGVIGYSKTLSLEVAADQITVNTICPGRIATGRLAKVFGSGAASTEELVKDIPLGRVGQPEEVAGLVVFLASSLGGYITGSTLAVDGGRLGSLV